MEKTRDLKGRGSYMQLSIRAQGEGAGILSHLLAKNPYNLYDRDEKSNRVRLVYTVFNEK
jgi:hypothetical protein